MQSFQMQNKRTKVLHIAAHLGEGVGKAIGGIALSDKVYAHEVVLLETPLKTSYVDQCKANGVEIHILPPKENLAKIMSGADVIVLNWWNHPLSLPVLSMLTDIPSRLMLWCHVNGIYYPRLPAEFAEGFDSCLFTSPVSLDVPYWSEKERRRIAGRSSVVYGLGNFNPEAQPFKSDYKISQPVRIGYVGTLDYAKMHQDFLKYCLAVLQRGIKAEFYLAGEPSDALTEDIRKLGLAKEVKLLGYRKDIADLLPTFDVFGYLLNKNNFATTENALLEALAAGLPVVTSTGMAEKAIVTDGENGYLASSPQEYADKVEKLLASEALRERMGRNGRKMVCNKYTSRANLSMFQQAIEEILGKEKVSHDFSGVLGKSACDAFIAFCPQEAKDIFEDVLAYHDNEKYNSFADRARELGTVFKTDKKGSPLQFLKYYPSDEGLQRICGLFK